MQRRWLEEPTSAPDSRSVDMAVARLAADGLWMADASGTSGYDQAMRAAVIDRIERLATGTEPLIIGGVLVVELGAQAPH